MRKITIRHVYERDYEIPDDMGLFYVADALVNYGQVLEVVETHTTDFQGDVEVVERGNIFNKPVSKMRYVTNLYDYNNSGYQESEAFFPVKEEEPEHA